MGRNLLSSPPRAMPTAIDVRTLVEGIQIRSLADTRGALVRYTLPTTLDEALAYLSFFQSIFTLLNLYQVYFPEEFMRSTREIVPAEDNAYSERELEFFALIDDRLFPLPWHMLDDVLEREERNYGFPLLAVGREWWDDDLRDWPLGWLMLLWLIGEGIQDEFERRRPDVAHVIETLARKEGSIALAALEKHCSQLAGPIVQFALALRILFHETGCWFLDAYAEDVIEELDPSRESMDRLTVHAHRMIEITEQADELITWLGADPITHFKEVLTLWNLYTLGKQDNHILLASTSQPNNSPNSQQ